jgi:RNA polymerase sigma factor (sigma-70 family)
MEMAVIFSNLTAHMIKQPMETLEMAITDSVAKKESNFETLYEQCFPLVARFVSKRSGSFQDAKDIFQDALVIYHEKSQSKNFKVDVTPEAYVLGIARHLWARKFGEDVRKVSAESLEADFSIPDDYFPSVNENLLLKLLEKTGEKCLSLLRFFYFEKQSIHELKRRFGFQSEHSASVQKYKCIEKVRETIKQNAISYEDFLE